MHTHVAGITIESKFVISYQAYPADDYEQAYGAEQLQASGAMKLLPITSAMILYSRLVKSMP